MSETIYLKTYSLEALRRAAKKRPPGYLDAVLSAAKSRTETHVILDARDAKRITDEYGGGVAITRLPTDAERETGGCSGCGAGKATNKTALPDKAWHEATNQGTQE